MLAPLHLGVLVTRRVEKRVQRTKLEFCRDSLAGLQIPEPDLAVGSSTDKDEGCRMELDQAGRDEDRHSLCVRRAQTGRTHHAVAALH